jgi:hypothetical protein
MNKKTKDICRVCRFYLTSKFSVRRYCQCFPANLKYITYRRGKVAFCAQFLPVEK